jgi:translation initiation factor SUI1
MNFSKYSKNKICKIKLSDFKDIIFRYDHDMSTEFGSDFPDVNNIIHIRVFQRSTRRYLTTIEGLDSSINLQKLLKCMKKTLSCNGVIKQDKSGLLDENGCVKYYLEISGDQRYRVQELLKNNNIEGSIVTHGW